MLLEKLFDNLALKVDPFATCRLAEGWRLQLPCRDWVTLHYTLQGDGGLRLGSGEVRALTNNSLAIMPPNIVHAIQCGAVSNETGVEGQGDPGAPLCELVAGPLDEVRLTIACGRIQVSYAGGMGLFDHLKEAIVLDFGDYPQMRAIFESLIDEYRRWESSLLTRYAWIDDQNAIVRIPVERAMELLAERGLPHRGGEEER